MTPYVATKIPTQHLQLWRRLDHVIARLPDLDLGLDQKGEPIALSCHMLARAIGRVFRLKVVDGEFVRGFAHSWLLTNDKRWIVDPYPVGIIGGPLIVDATGAHMPGAVLYKKRSKICKLLLFSSPEFRRAVNLIAAHIRQIIQT